MCAFLVGISLTASGRARAQPGPRDVVVVDVSPPGSLDAYRLRAAVGVELGVDAVADDDRRAATASGTLHVVVDTDSHHLTVTYRKKTEPESRTVDLPADPEAAQRAAVVLAGNLGRDEASELAAQLRKAPSPAPAETVPPRSPSGAPAIDDTENDDTESGARDLQAALDYYAAQDRRLRLALGWTTATATAVAAVAVATSPLIANATGANGPRDWTSPALIAVGLSGMTFLSLIPILTPTPLENLAEYDRGGAGPDATAQAWIRAAAHEHSVRKTAGVLNILSGSFELALGVGAALYWDPHAPATGADAVFSAVMIGLGSVNVLVAIATLASDGPTETALHAYERGHGIPLWKLAEHVAVAPTPGGAVSSFGFRF